MKFLQNLMPAKTLTLVQSIVCLVVMLALFIMSLGTIFTAKLESSADMEEGFNEIAGELGLENVSFPSEVEISAPNLISSFAGVADFIGAAFDTASAAGNAMGSANNAMNAANEMQNSEDLDDVAANAAKAEQDMDALEDDMSKLEDSAANMMEKASGLVGMIAIILVIAEAFGQSIILGLVYMGLIGTVIALPFIFGIKLLMSIVSFFKNMNDPYVPYPKMAKRIGDMFGAIVGLMFLKVIAPEIEFSAGVTTMIVICVLVFLFNLVASRMKTFTETQTKYQNAVQIVSASGLVAFFIFFFGLSGTDLFNRIWSGLGDFLGKTLENAAGAAFQQQGAQDNMMGNLITMGLIVVMIALLFKVFDYLKQGCCRLACMVPAGKLLSKDCYIIRACMALVMIIVPVYLMNPDDYALTLSDEGMTAFIVMCVGIVLMIAAEIVLMVLKKSYCEGLTTEDVQAVLTGHPMDEVAEAAAPAAEAEAPAAEAPAAEENKAE